MSIIDRPDDDWWIISVGGYGSFFFCGTEQAAEKMRRHKARWEQAAAQKRKATESELKNGRVSREPAPKLETK